ncbi:nitrilotriacetate monooxygenase [Pelagivirga sediminicola]|uniref:Nitrilotriacetate monooxygenase n=1 Tax=Pelagivirga sediminicola TaxID=2170575 RepID=A0A2T7GBX8_9RHOB|nr:flavin reductase family protein [Pelagivirga sediminicola]PVA11888.1 nitrilotriacetate monooxygenase [Pelagivirga sediminicola]
MQYGDTRPDSLPHNPFKAIVTPRPIGWIGTLDPGGLANLAPYSFFNAIGSDPDMVMFSSEGAKHSATYARERGEFTFSLATAALAEQMNTSSAPEPSGVNEFELAGLEQGTPSVIQTPFVAASPAAFECVTLDVRQLSDRHGTLLDRFMVIGEVVQTHIRDDYITDGRFDTVRARPIARMGYADYATVTEAWQMGRPKR